jgi:hypothetical protein
MTTKVLSSSPISRRGQAKGKSSAESGLERASKSPKRRSSSRSHCARDGHRFESTSLPLQGVRVLERSCALAARLAGLLLADQGAAVFALDRDDAAEENIDHYLNRGKNLVPARMLVADENADIHIGDNDSGEVLPPWQISLGFTAVVPGDEDCDLPPDASDDLLNGMVGFYTDLCVTGRLLGREVIYTPLPLCSVYAAVLGATAVCAALADRQRTGAGRAIVIPRLAAGLSAIGVLAMGLEGIEPHLVPPSLAGARR